MAPVPNLRISLNGDTSQAFREGDKVKGSLTLVLEQEEVVKSVKIAFAGECTTKATRPLYVSDIVDSDRDYTKTVELFRTERTLVTQTKLASSKHSWDFDFTFPLQTEPQYSRWAHGKQFPRAPHPLPPTFQLRSDSPHGSTAEVSYFVQATLELPGKRKHQVTELVGYLPNSTETTRQAQVRSRVLYAQTWKPGQQPQLETRTKFDKVFDKVRRHKESSTVPRIIPTIYSPDKIAPGQHIPLLLCLVKANIGDYPEVTLDSLKVTLSTFTTTICGQPLAQPEDTVSKHVTCIAKSNLNKSIAYSTPTPLTHNFRLIDNAECVPTFSTYTICRRYTMSINLTLKCSSPDSESPPQTHSVSCTTPLEITPRLPRSGRRSSVASGVENEDEVDPLPLYEMLEPLRELAPDYETLYSLSPTESMTSNASSNAGGYFQARSMSVVSAMSTAPTTPGSPGMEVERVGVGVGGRPGMHQRSMSLT